MEVRRLLHAGHDHGDDEPVVQPGVNEPVPGDVVPVLGAEPLNSLSSIPVLNSLPGASVSVYLDFDGSFQPSWGSYGSVTTPVYDRDGDAGTFSDSELLAIEQIWAQVAEDFAPFNLNVTTVEPPSFANGVAVRVAIGGDGAWTGGTYGGIAYVNSFTSGIPNTVFVFPANLSNGNPKRVAEASSHETGHSFGLDHQSLYNGSGQKVAEYYSGPGNGTAPIMGNSYSATRGLWWQGTSSDGPSVIQDDLSVISRAQNGFGYRSDDYGNTVATASPLPSAHVANGIITTTSDVDYFSFDTGAGQVTLTLTVPAQNNLDARLELRTVDGTLITSAAPANSFGATIVASLQAGSYRIVVASQGNYGDIGEYSLTADILAPSVEGHVFFDADRDGTLDNEEPGLAGWTVFDDLNNNGVRDLSPQFSLSATDTPGVIPQVGSIRSTIVSSGISGTILDVNVKVTLTHDDVSQLTLALVDPFGSTTTLMAFDPTGGTAMVETRFDNEAAISISDAAAPYTGTFRPLGSLAGLNGKSPNGTWKLLVSDVVSGGVGVLQSFSMEITTSVAEPSTTTDSAGRYLFAFSGAGEHHIRQVGQTGYAPTSPQGGVYNVTLGAGSNFNGLDFGNGPPAVVGRSLFYNQSKFDANDPTINAADDSAIATDKAAYQPGVDPATFASVSSYSRGINGIMVDVAGLPGSITTDDFIFRVGNNNSPATWPSAPSPTNVIVRPGAGTNGSSRIELTWANGVIKNQWLQVIVKGNDALGGFNTSTGLAASDEFYWGSRIADSGTNTGTLTFDTSSTDAAQVFATVGTGKAVTELRDYNRDGQVTSTDAAIVFGNIGSIARIDLASVEPLVSQAALAVTTDEFDVSAIVSGVAMISRAGYREAWAVPVRTRSGEHRGDQHVQVARVNRELIDDRPVSWQASDELLDAFELDEAILADLLA